MTAEREIDTPWLTLSEAAAYGRISQHEMGDLLRSGRIVGTQLSGPNSRWRVRREAIDAFYDGVPYVPTVPVVTRRRGET